MRTIHKYNTTWNEGHTLTAMQLRIFNLQSSHSNWSFNQLDGIIFIAAFADSFLAAATCTQAVGAISVAGNHVTVEIDVLVISNKPEGLDTKPLNVFGG